MKHLGRLSRSPYAPYGVVALAVLLPLMTPGFVLMLDMVFVPRLRAPIEPSNTFLWEWLLWALNSVVAADVLQKLVLGLILVGSGAGMHRLVQYLWAHQGHRLTQPDIWGAYIAGVVYTINPYTYSRFMAGQYLVLLGYALLPFFVRACFEFLARPQLRESAVLAAWVVAISLVSLHSLGLVVVSGGLAFLLGLWQHRSNVPAVMRRCQYAALSIALIVLASSYWLIPTWLGYGSIAGAAGHFDAKDSVAFATEGNTALGKFANVIRLQGFWAEGQGLYVQPQDRVPAWGLVMLGFWVLVVVGGISLWRRGQRFIVLWGGAVAGAAICLAVWGVPVVLVKWLPFLGGYREPHKFVGLLALVYAVFGSYGAVVCIRRFRKQHLTLGILAGGLIALTPTMLWGCNGQLRPRHYPADWNSMDHRLAQDNDDFQTLFLPWHMYMHFGFADRIIANPAGKFFDKPVLVSNDPEFGDIKPALSDPTKQAISKLLNGTSQPSDLAEPLAGLNIKYVILAKEQTTGNYAFMDQQRDFRLTAETATLKLYKNETWK